MSHDETTPDETPLEETPESPPQAGGEPEPVLEPTDAELAARLAVAYDTVKREIAKVIIGQEAVVDLLLVSLFSRGHSVFVGVPGLAKTLLVSTLARVLSMSFQRIQFTPDLMPADITGTDILEEDRATGRREFRFVKGPLFANIILADEVNRTPPKTQAALLQAMQEKEVTAGGQTHELPHPFLVFATQNPIEQEGTYPLPEAQLDRFLVQIDVAYPDRKTEKDILLATTGTEEAQAHQVFDPATLMAAQHLLRRMPVGDAVVEMILDLVRAFRPADPSSSARVRDTVAWGPGPRAAQALMLTVRARALLQGRLAPSPEDVMDMARPVLVHRMALTFSARARGEDLGGIIDEVCGALEPSEAAA